MHNKPAITAEEIQRQINVSFAEKLAPTYNKMTSKHQFAKAGELLIYGGDNPEELQQALDKGADAIVSNKALYEQLAHPRVFYTDTPKPLKTLAQYMRQRFQHPVIAVTGSVGKSTVRAMLVHVLAEHNVVTNKGNRNGGTGLMNALLSLTPDTDFLVLEVASSRPGSLKFRGNLVRPTIALVTAVAESHMENYQSVKQLATEKFTLFRRGTKGSVGFTTANVLTHFGQQLTDAPPKNTAVTSLGGEADAIRLISVDKSNDYMQVSVSVDDQPFKFKLHSLARHDADNTLFVFAVAQQLGLDLHNVAQRLASYRGPNQRLQKQTLRLADHGQITIVDDSFNSSPTAVKGALEAIAHLQGFDRKIFVFGDMLELSSDPSDVHKQMAEVIKANGFSYLITVGEHSRVMKAAADENFSVTHFEDVDAARNHLCKIVRHKDLVLVKGSHGSNVYQLVGKLKQSLST